MDADLALLERWRGGDLRAGDDLFRRYMPEVLRFFERKAGARAEDLTQQTFLDCLKSLKQFQGLSSFRTYLFAIARNELFGYFRREANRADIDFAVSSIADLGASMSSPSSHLERVRESRRLHDALARLPLEQQILLEYHYWYGVDASGLSEMLGLSPGNVRVRLLRARRALRKLLEEPASADEVAGDDPLTMSLVALRGEDEVAPVDQ